MKKLVSIVISLLILAGLYWSIDRQSLVQVLRQCDRLWLVISLAMVVPLTWLTAVRLQWLVPGEVRLSLGEANRLILAACTLNMILPSKMGDIAKAYFIRDRGHLDGSLALSLVVFEKACDLLALLLWCALGLILYPRRDWLFGVMTIAVVLGLGLGLGLIGSRSVASVGFRLADRVLRGGRSPRQPRAASHQLAKLQGAWSTMHHYFWGNPRQLTLVAGLSIFIWFLHLLQIWFFSIALKATVPFLANLALAPLALLAGLLPLTFAGVGTRDAALIGFYQPYFGAATGAALGLLCTSRYLLPAIGGLPFLGRYLAAVRGFDRHSKEFRN